MKESFQDGVDLICDKCTDLGSAPNPKDPKGICDAIDNIWNNRYNDGLADGLNDAIFNCRLYSSGHQTQVSVKGSYVAINCIGISNATSTAPYFTVKVGNNHSNNTTLVNQSRISKSGQIYAYDLANNNYNTCYIMTTGWGSTNTSVTLEVIVNY